MLAQGLITFFLASTAFAAPARREQVKSMSSSAAKEWTVLDMSRDCNKDDTKCTWTFSVDKNEDGFEPVDCEYIIEGDPASETPGVTPQSCEPFTITSGYDSSGFTVLSIVDYDTGKIVWAGYNDDVLENGETVTPDRSWAVSDLP
ncbi:putative surface protein 1 protein [Emericellopsis cladophorae]|uniref:Surface protein 1 protein n=1 Tax=Emericellopsis cladophorae TaxID=2686198 RepID=A0A9P9XVH3_9HYPO|nr:putative surface protein 1 protein [Emericellopsis cladophorae]KAI6778573.1 putative surface protein 1 protein [Emericellopsis cladophorae]